MYRSPLFIAFAIMLGVTSILVAETTGAASNVLTANGKTVTLTYFRAHLHDNAEGLLDTPNELRILLADHEVPADALDGIAFLPVRQLAMDGKVHGLLLKLDPAKPGKVTLTLLWQPAGSQGSLMTQTLSSSANDIIKGFKIDGGKVSGAIQGEHKASDFLGTPAMQYMVSFQAAVEKEPAVTADLTGKSAHDSAEVAILKRKGEALKKKDFKALQALSTESSFAKGELMLSNPQAQQMLSELGAHMIQAAGTVTRVVERGDHAVAIFPDKNWSNFVKVAGQWKSDD